ncbi:hypothetical protein GBF38_006748, partial [Nibea albiflora]
ETEDELEQIHSDSDSLSENSHCSLDEDYVPRGPARGSDLDDFTDEDSSDEEWNNTPTKRRGSRKRRRSVSASPVKSPSKKWERSPLKKKIQNGATPRKNTSASPKTGKAFSTPRRGNQIGRRRTERQLSREEEDGADDGDDRWLRRG